MAASKSKKTTTSASSLYREKPKKSRKGVHAKTKMSKNKTSKNKIHLKIKS